jgi:DNA topoisomerase VI subunit B
MTSPQPTLQRSAFTTSRSMEFFTQKELTMQIGHPRQLWALALLKELIDNALDACEAAGIAPQISITLEADMVSIRDNGQGLPEAVLERSLDYLVRVSDKAHYCAPTRGQLGNALKCVWAAPFVLDGEQGRVEVATGGKTHRIEVSLDRIRQQPQMQHTIEEDGVVKTGTLFRIYWPRIALSQ